MKNDKKAEEIAVERMQLISPLLADGIDPGKAKELKKAICEQTGLSERTLRRYLSAYRAEGFAGLRPQGKGQRQTAEAITPYLLEQAILLRREVPSRSVAQIIQILEWEGLAKPGEIKRSTLQEKLMENGYSTRHMRLYSTSGLAARRFQHKQRNQLWQADIKFGPYLPIGEGGANKQVYLVAFIDDATRYVLHAAFYPTLDQTIVEDCFRFAIQTNGVPDSVYFDNGKQFRTKSMTRTCAKLGIRLRFTRPYAAESKGKIERFNRVIDSFLTEAALEKPQTLDQLNLLFQVWLTECYQTKPHSALDDNSSPQVAFRSGSTPLRLAEESLIADAFLHSETRKVDKAGCISFMGKKYEVGLSFIGQKVEVVYDPRDISTITIEYGSHTPWQAKELIIGEWAGRRPSIPSTIEPLIVEGSRLLDAAEKKNQVRKERQTRAVSFRKIREEAKRDV
ncbi:transposase [Tumebacillus avium]|uniref:Transposase n=2 Tax=Tumebacillus avium TaxID=1903704 RepID=A0A1Y0IRX6_9BACL|nr:DDE-type integrase/transposase/recombinase [Tumebacillus avium]ARU60491.1 transposase [Tumebacillus avium]ARU61984.1 transposase [Tumebacillus avium]ARU62104.1 transposase [Tumebacillus avium]ARU62668.1 transposase [Tumebacillus avium]ARU62749.1 transposase [Tumebacillus avium]